MPPITRRLPQSNISRELAIRQAHFKMRLVPPADMALTPNTQTRLTAMQTGYPAGLTAVANAKSDLNANTPLKDAAVNRLRMFVSHFIQVFNFGVSRGKYPAADRSRYQLDTESAALPDMVSELLVQLWANRLVDGDAERITAGGLPMANPDIAEVETERQATLLLFGNQTTLTDVLDHAQEALDDINEEADTLIKRVWDEVETFYGEEEPESMRQNAQQWGVVYITEGPSAILTGLVKNGAGIGQAGIEVVLVQTGAVATTNPEGRFEISTKVVGAAIVRVIAGAPPVNYDSAATIPEDHDGVTITVADIVIP